MIIKIIIDIQASARPGYCFTQYSPDFRQPVGHLLPRSLGIASNRAEQSHEATRVCERGMRRFKSVGQAQRFLGAHAAVSNLGRHLVRAQHYRDLRVSAFS